MDDLTALPARIRELPTTLGFHDAFTLAADGCKVMFVDVPAGTVLPVHTHDTDNVTAILTGEAILTIDGKERRYGPGEWYETSANEPHAVRFEERCVQIELRFATDRY